MGVYITCMSAQIEKPKALILPLLYASGKEHKAGLLHVPGDLFVTLLWRQLSLKSERTSNHFLKG